MRSNTQNDYLDWTELKNWIPIISAAFIIGGAFVSVTFELASLSKKVEELTQSTRQLNDHEVRISVLERQ